MKIAEIKKLAISKGIDFKIVDRRKQGFMSCPESFNDFEVCFCGEWDGWLSSSWFSEFYNYGNKRRAVVCTDGAFFKEYKAFAELIYASEDLQEIEWERRW